MLEIDPPVVACMTLFSVCIDRSRANISLCFQQLCTVVVIVLWLLLLLVVYVRVELTVCYRPLCGRPPPTAFTHVI